MSVPRWAFEIHKTQGLNTHRTAQNTWCHSPLFIFQTYDVQYMSSIQHIFKVAAGTKLRN